MTVRIGDIELTRLQRVEVDEGRNLIEHRLPGSPGSIFQDLGRGAVSLRLAGTLLGEAALREIETLRAAHAAAMPLRFSADVAVGSELTDVLIQDFVVQQVPGHRFRYEFTLEVREWIEPPEAPGAAIAEVNAEVAADAAIWTEQGLALGGALGDPGRLAGVIAGDGELLARISTDELAQAVVGSLGDLDAADFAELLGSVAGVDPTAVVALVDTLAEADSWEDLFEIMSGEGAELLERLSGIEVPDRVRAFLAGPEFIDGLSRVREAAQALLETLRAWNPLEPLDQLGAPPRVGKEGPGA